MSFRRMTRMISFRVSEHEFELLRSKSEALGARSVSDYARVVLCNSASALGSQNGTDIHHLNNGIERLSVEIRRLFDLLESPQASLAGRDAASANHNGGMNNV